MKRRHYENTGLDLYVIVGGDWWFYLDWGPFSIYLVRRRS